MASQSTATMIDSLYDNVDAIASTLKSVKLYQIAMILDGFLLFILNCLLFIIAAGYMMIAKYGMAITFLLAPVFVAFALFDVSRHWFSAWLGKMLTFVWMYVLVVAIVRMGFFTFKDAIDQAGQLASSGFHPAMLTSNLTGQLVIVMAVMTLFMLGVRSWAAALGGGAVGSSGALVLITRGVIGSLKGGKK
jgi:type IV secretion system protein VirB6